MREYEPEYPLEALDRLYYPNLFRDSNDVVLSENITFFVLRKSAGLNKILEEIESKVRKGCSNTEVAYRDFSGNRWIFLVLNKKPSQPTLRRMQTVYTKLSKKMMLCKN
jgi:hypothetical protein